MPRRRRLTRALSGFSSGASDILSSLLQSRIVGGRQEQAQQAVSDRELLNNFIASTSGLMDPEKVQKAGPEAQRQQYLTRRSLLPTRLQDQLGTGEPDFTALDAPPSERMAPARRRVTEATNPEAIPSEYELRQLMSENRVAPDELKNVTTSPAQGPVSGFPLVTGGELGPTQDLEKLLAEATQRKDALTTERNRTTPREAITDELSGITSFLTEAEQGQKGTMKTKLTPQEEAAKQAGITTATKSAEEGVTNLPANQQARARGAGLVAGAQKRAELSAELGAMGITGQQQQGALQLADDFEKQTADYAQVRNSYQQLAQLATKATPAADIGIVFSYMKMLDPGSTVREGEAATIRNAAGIPERVRLAYNRALSGEGLDSSQRVDIVRTARTLYNTAQADHQDVVKTFTDRATALRVPPSLVVREIAEPRIGAETSTTSGATEGTALDTLRQRRNRLGGPGPRGN